ncbi:unnamed protein product, partial [Ectocarpus sp. 8 AP-2014]
MICSRKPRLTRRNRFVACRTAVCVVVFDSGGRCDGRTVVPPPPAVELCAAAAVPSY